MSQPPCTIPLASLWFPQCRVDDAAAADDDDDAYEEYDEEAAADRSDDDEASSDDDDVVDEEDMRPAGRRSGRNAVPGQGPKLSDILAQLVHYALQCSLLQTSVTTYDCAAAHFSCRSELESDPVATAPAATTRGRGTRSGGSNEDGKRGRQASPATAIVSGRKRLRKAA